MDLRLKKSLALFAVTVLTSFLNVNMASATDVSDWNALQSEIVNTTTPNSITFSDNIAGASSALGV